jgi:hypothetical protein
MFRSRQSFEKGSTSKLAVQINTGELSIRYTYMTSKLTCGELKPNSRVIDSRHPRTALHVTEDFVYGNIPNLCFGVVVYAGHKV